MVCTRLFSVLWQNNQTCLIFAWLINLFWGLELAFSAFAVSYISRIQPLNSERFIFFLIAIGVILLRQILFRFYDKLRDKIIIAIEAYSYDYWMGEVDNKCFFYQHKTSATTQLDQLIEKSTALFFAIFERFFYIYDKIL